MSYSRGKLWVSRKLNFLSGPLIMSTYSDFNSLDGIVNKIHYKLGQATFDNKSIENCTSKCTSKLDLIVPLSFVSRKTEGLEENILFLGATHHMIA